MGKTEQILHFVLVLLKNILNQTLLDIKHNDTAENSCSNSSN